MRFLSGIGSRRAICLDWDARFLRAVEATVSRSGVRVLNAVQTPVPPEVQIAAADSLGDFIRKTLDEAGIRGGSLVVDVPRQDAVLNQLTLPPTSENEMAAMVRFQIGKELPFAMDQGVVDFALLGTSETDGKSMQILVAAIRKHVLEYYQAVAEAAGLELGRVGLRPFANVIALTRDGENRKGRVILVDVGPSMTEIDVIRNGRLVFSRAAAMTVQPATPVEETEAKRPDVIPFMSSPGSTSSVDALLVEVTRSVEAYRATDPGAKIDRVVVSGACGVEAELAKKLAKRFEAPVAIYEPAQDLVRELNRRTQVPLGGFGAALGLAWGQEQTGFAHFDFLHPKEPVDVTREKLRRVPVIASLVGLLILSGVTGAVLKIRNKSNELDRIGTELKNEQQQIDQMKAFFAVSDAVETWRRRSIMWLDEVYGVVKALPENKDAYLRELTTTEKGEIVLKMVATNDDVLAKLRDRLKDLKTDKGKARFFVDPGSKSASNDTTYPVYTEIRLQIASMIETPSPKKS